MATVMNISEYGNDSESNSAISAHYGPDGLADRP